MQGAATSASLLSPELPRSALLRYSLAAAAVAAALLVRWLLLPLFGGSVPFMFFFPAIMFAGWLGGLGPGLLATGLSGLGASYFLFLPQVPLASRLSTRAFQLLVFLAIGLLITLLNERLHVAWRRAADIGEENRRQAEALLQARESALEGEKERTALLSATELARLEAEAASRSKDEFLAIVSHELRTPLNAILGWAQLLLTDRLESAKRQRGLETISRNARLQAQLIDDLLDVSRITSGKIRLDLAPVDLAMVIDAALAAIQPAAEAKQIRLRKVLDPLAGSVAGDAARLQQVVWNLLSNAVKFTPDHGTVQVRLERAGSHLEHVEITVADNGPGIPPDFLPHAFDLFRQHDSSTTRRQGGLGLGLAIVRQLVELQGGSVEVKSPGEGGRGSAFVVRLPVSIVPLAPQPQAY